jgi:hypothetical protein
MATKWSGTERNNLANYAGYSILPPKVRYDRAYYLNTDGWKNKT